MSLPDLATIETQVRAAGLDAAWENFREDVIAAAHQVAAQRAALDAVPPADEPWPPMRVGLGL
jgi:hypothetical protein